MKNSKKAKSLKSDTRRSRLLKTRSIMFYAISDGVKRIYTNRDGIKGYGVNRIPNPYSVSFINVFINGVLQLKPLYKVRKGKLLLLSDDVPVKGIPIIVQSVKIIG
ncbi:MAG TPA: DUF4183 domain-containing protein [Paenibacillus sp.]|uniref:DUF4183 domain-containing protein n=1 Tax=Paenibacillus sp. TaxID=58172 RepID=UPI002BD2DB4A|nr:DUF4183 domain-containing protein [Paenibacillus sp.]HUC92255.1 DUF4183 domain-containing protein [Paenibacillus sp.]